MTGHFTAAHFSHNVAAGGLEWPHTQRTRQYVTNSARHLTHAPIALTPSPNASKNAWPAAKA